MLPAPPSPTSFRCIIVSLAWLQVLADEQSPTKGKALQAACSATVYAADARGKATHSASAARMAFEAWRRPVSSRLVWWEQRRNRVRAMLRNILQVGLKTVQLSLPETVSKCLHAHFCTSLQIVQLGHGTFLISLASCEKSKLPDMNGANIGSLTELSTVHTVRGTMQGFLRDDAVAYGQEIWNRWKNAKQA